MHIETSADAGFILGLKHLRAARHAENLAREEDEATAGKLLDFAWRYRKTAISLMAPMDDEALWAEMFDGEEGLQGECFPPPPPQRTRDTR